MRILAVNSGSSSLKFALYEETRKQLSGSFSHIGSEKGKFKAADEEGKVLEEGDEDLQGHREAAAYLIGWLRNKGVEYDRVAHRIVQGGPGHFSPVKLSEEVMAALREWMPLAPDHLPQELSIIDKFREEDSSKLQIACFDTAFHRSRPQHRQKYALPEKFTRQGILRYGFHGIAYESVLREMKKRAPHVSEGKMIACHLGSGASIAAIEEGDSRDTTMGFTPVSGLVMSTRTGELDPEVVLYLQRSFGMGLDEVHQMIHRESGLLGLSELSGDMEELLRAEKANGKAREAVQIFCESVVKHIGALVSVLGGVESLIFSGGIGENAAEIRKRVCSRLRYLGVEIDSERNREGGFRISGEESAVQVFIVKANEESILAEHAAKF